VVAIHRFHDAAVNANNHNDRQTEADRRRIAQGQTARRLQEVNELLKQYAQAKR